jgi:hypothetical protein
MKLRKRIGGARRMYTGKEKKFIQNFEGTT